jgi:hypothetical protein
MFTRFENEWCDGRQNGGRRPRLLAISPSGEVVRFFGEHIPGVVAVVCSAYHRNGKWSETIYGLRTAPGAVIVETLERLHQRPFDAYESWAAVVSDCERVAGRSVDPASLRAVIEAEYPGSIERLDGREAALATVATVAPTTYILNSAVIAEGGYGTYRYDPATIAGLKAALEGRHESRIGYEATADAIERWTGIRPALSRELSRLEPGDVAIIVRLKYRVDPRSKSSTRPRDEDFEIARLERLT